MDKPNYEAGEEEDFLEFDSSSDENTKNPENLSKKQMYPWIKSSSKINNSALRFHVEIMEFYKYISPTEQDILKRREIFEHIRDTIKVTETPPLTEGTTAQNRLLPLRLAFLGIVPAEQ